MQQGKSEKTISIQQFLFLFFGVFFFFFSVYLPGHERLTLEGCECKQTSGEAEPADLHQGDAVEEDAVRQHEGDVGPAHTGPHGQQPVHHVDQ